MSRQVRGQQKLPKELIPKAPAPENRDAERSVGRLARGAAPWHPPRPALDEWNERVDELIAEAQAVRKEEDDVVEPF